jgi:hypothetical protein
MGIQLNDEGMKKYQLPIGFERITSTNRCQKISSTAAISKHK